MQENSRDQLLKTSRQALYVLGLYWFALNIPFQNKFPPTALGLMIFGLAWILRKNWKSLFVQLRRNPAFIISLLLFIWTLIGTSYSPDPKAAEREWVLKIPLIGWPLAFAGWEKYFSISRTKLLKGFVLSCLLSSLILLFSSFSAFIESGMPDVLFYKALMKWEFVPAHYLSMYISFASALSFHWMLLALEKRNVKITLSWALVTIVFIAMIALSGIRIQWLVMPLLMLIVSIYNIRRNRRLLQPALGLLVFSSAMIISSPEVRRRASESIIEWKAMKNEVEGYQTNERYFLWTHAWEIIGEKPLLGHGTGGGDYALNESLESESAQFWDGQKLVPLNAKRYNLHSEFLQHLASHGIIGLSLFLALFLFPIFYFKGKLPLFQWLFLICCALSFTTESMLQRQAGVFFFAFFYALLIIDLIRLKDQKE